MLETAFSEILAFSIFQLFVVLENEHSRILLFYHFISDGRRLRRAADIIVEYTVFNGGLERLTE